MSLIRKHLNLFRFHHLKYFTVLVCGVLCACSSLTNLQGEAPASLTFAHIAPASVPVNDVSLSSAVQRPVEPQSFVVDVEDWVASYFAHKIQPDGEFADGALNVNIQGMTLNKTYEPQGNAVVRFFEVSGHDVYTLELLIDLRADDVPGFETYGTRMEFEKSVKVPEYASLAQREAMQMRLVEELTLTIDHEVEQFLHAVFR